MRIRRWIHAVTESIGAVVLIAAVVCIVIWSAVLWAWVKANEWRKS